MKRSFSLLISLFMILNLCGGTEPVPPSPAELSGPAQTTEAAPLPEPTPEPTAGPELRSPSAEDTPPPCEPSADFQPAPSPVPGEKAPSIFDLVASDSAAAGSAFEVDMAAYYLKDMCTAAAAGNTKAGQAAEKSRNAAIDAGGKGEKIRFDELLLLSRVIYSEAGSDWLSEDFRICTGEVVLNRVASPEFPDSIYDVVYQKGQYSGVNSARFQNLAPGEDCVEAALKLLQGERRMVPSVVYQSDMEQGEIFSMYSDWRLGNTYFCLSPNQELYPID